jgi:hypothetical protein
MTYSGKIAKRPNRTFGNRSIWVALDRIYVPTLLVRYRLYRPYPVHVAHCQSLPAMASIMSSEHWHYVPRYFPAKGEASPNSTRLGDRYIKVGTQSIDLSEIGEKEHHC